MKSLSKIIIVSILGALACILAVLFVVKPGLDDISAVNTEVKQKKTELATLDQQIKAFIFEITHLEKAITKADAFSVAASARSIVRSNERFETKIG